MKINIQSTVAFGYGGGGAEALALIYEHLLTKYNQCEYSHIGLVQVDTIWSEVLFKTGKAVHINIFYPAFSDFEQRSIDEKNWLRLDMFHTALLRIADFENKLNKEVLEIIKKEVIKNNFQYELTIKTRLKKTAKEKLEALIILIPEMYVYHFFFIFRKNDVEVWRALFFKGNPSIWFNVFFSKSEWKSNNQFTVHERDNKFQLNFFVDKKEVWLIYQASQKRLNTYNLNADVTQQKFDHIPPDGVLIYSET